MIRVRLKTEAVEAILVRCNHDEDRARPGRRDSTKRTWRVSSRVARARPRTRQRLLGALGGEREALFEGRWGLPARRGARRPAQNAPGRILCGA